MPTESPPLKRGERGWKTATFVIFVGTGITYASWVTRTPAIRSSLGVGTGDMGLIILGLSIGSVAGLLLAGPVVARIGARHVITAAAAATIASLGLLTVGLGSGLAGRGPGCFRRRPDERSRVHAVGRARPGTRRSGGTPGSSSSD